jgi:hypothetical protein
MMTSQKQISLFTEEKSTSLLEDFPANHTQHRGKDWEKKTNVIYGQKCLEQLEKLNQGTLWGKTFLALLIGMEDWYSKRCKLTWNLKGTKYNRLYFQLVPSTLHIGENECGLWPTPTSVQRNHPERVIGLKEKGATTMMSRKNGEQRPNSILDQAMFNGLIPTPTASDNRNRGNPQDPCVKNRLEKGKQVGLTMMVDGLLNPQFVMEMMGFPNDWTLLPFQENNGMKNQSKEEETQ